MIIRGGVAKATVESARRAVYRSMKQGYEKDDCDLARLAALKNSPHVLSQIYQLLGGEVNVHKCSVNTNMPQVAVQYPEGNIEIAPKLAATYQSGHVTNGTRIRYPHIDGCYMGGPTDTFNPFTVLVMIALSDVPKDFCGNLVVYPGSHKTIGNQFKDNHENLKYLWKQNNNNSTLLT